MPRRFDPTDFRTFRYYHQTVQVHNDLSGVPSTDKDNHDPGWHYTGGATTTTTAPKPSVYRVNRILPNGPDGPGEYEYTITDGVTTGVIYLRPLTTRELEQYGVTAPAPPSGAPAPGEQRTINNPDGTVTVISWNPTSGQWETLQTLGTPEPNTPKTSIRTMPDGSVVMLDDTTGQVIRVIAGPSYGSNPSSGSSGGRTSYSSGGGSYSSGGGSYSSGGGTSVSDIGPVNDKLQRDKMAQDYALQLRQFGLSEQEIAQKADQFNRTLAFNTQQAFVDRALDLGKLGLSEQQITQDYTVQLAKLGLDASQILQQANQFAATLGFQQQQFNVTTALDAARLGLSEQQVAKNYEVQLLQLGLDAATAKQKAGEFAANLTLQQQQLGIQTGLETAKLGLAEEQMAKNYEVQLLQLGMDAATAKQKADEFAATLQFNKDQALAQREIDLGKLGLTEEQIKSERAKWEQELALGQARLGLDATSEFVKALSSTDPIAATAFWQAGGGNLMNAYRTGNTAITPELLNAGAEILAKARAAGGSGLSPTSSPLPTYGQTATARAALNGLGSGSTYTPNFQGPTLPTAPTSRITSGLSSTLQGMQTPIAAPTYDPPNISGSWSPVTSGLGDTLAGMMTPITPPSPNLPPVPTAGSGQQSIMERTQAAINAAIAANPVPGPTPYQPPANQFATIMPETFGFPGATPPVNQAPTVPETSISATGQPLPPETGGVQSIFPPPTPSAEGGFGLGLESAPSTTGPVTPRRPSGTYYPPAFARGSYGYVNDRAFISGDTPHPNPFSGRPNPEMVFNPTGAPIAVVPLGKLGLGARRFATGTYITGPQYAVTASAYPGQLFGYNPQTRRYDMSLAENDRLTPGQRYMLNPEQSPSASVFLPKQGLGGNEYKSGDPNYEYNKFIASGRNPARYAPSEYGSEDEANRWASFFDNINSPTLSHNQQGEMVFRNPMNGQEIVGMGAQEAYDQWGQSGGSGVAIPEQVSPAQPWGNLDPYAQAMQEFYANREAGTPTVAPRFAFGTWEGGFGGNTSEYQPVRALETQPVEPLPPVAPPPTLPPANDSSTASPATTTQQPSSNQLTADAPLTDFIQAAMPPASSGGSSMTGGFIGANPPVNQAPTIPETGGFIGANPPAYKDPTIPVGILDRPSTPPALTEEQLLDLEWRAAFMAPFTPKDPMQGMPQIEPPPRPSWWQPGMPAYQPPSSQPVYTPEGTESGGFIGANPPAYMAPTTGLETQRIGTPLPVSSGSAPYNPQNPTATGTGPDFLLPAPPPPATPPGRIDMNTTPATPEGILQLRQNVYTPNYASMAVALTRAPRYVQEVWAKAMAAKTGVPWEAWLEEVARLRPLGISRASVGIGW